MSMKVSDLEKGLRVYEKDWGIAKADSDCDTIVTASFGPCCVVAIIGGKFAAMAHIDCCTDLNSIKVIFDRFKENAVETKDMKITLLGGWSVDVPSLESGQKILEKIRQFAPDAKLNRSYLYQRSPTDEEYTLLCKSAEGRESLTKKEKRQVDEIDSRSYYCGAFVNATTGQIGILQNVILSLQNERRWQLEEFQLKHGEDIETTDFPITEVVWNKQVAAVGEPILTVSP